MIYRIRIPEGRKVKHMKISELIYFVYDKVFIYKEKGEGEFINLYIGGPPQVPKEFLEMEIKTIGAKRKGILDIQVK